MDIGAIVSRARKAAADNTPTILTAIGVTGTIATAILAGKASFKAQQIIDEHTGPIWHPKDPDRELTMSPREKVEFTWKLYIPAATTGAITVACIVASNHVNTRRAAALASAYSVSQEAFREYKDKVFEKVGEKKEKVIRDEITQDRVNKNPPGPLILVGNNVLCLDTHSGRYFDCNMEDIRKAVNDINWQILNDNYASLTDFWEMLGLSRTADSDEIGWNTDTKFEVQYSAALSEDGKPVLAIDFRTIPVRSFYKLY